MHELPSVQAQSRWQGAVRTLLVLGLFMCLALFLRTQRGW